MPLVSTFYGIIITMYYGSKEHFPPHFHAWYSGSMAAIDFDGNILEGEMPNRALKLITAWAELHRDELKASWEFCQQEKNPLRIEPLR